MLSETLDINLGIYDCLTMMFFHLKAVLGSLLDLHGKRKRRIDKHCFELENIIGPIYRRIDLYANRISYYYKANVIRKKMS